MSVSVPLTLYIASLSARKITDVINSTQQEVHSVHTPVWLVALSLDDAEQETRKMLLANWPEAGGWSGWSASIRRVSNPFINTLHARGFIFADNDPANCKFFQIDDPFADL